MLICCQHMSYVHHVCVYLNNFNATAYSLLYNLVTFKHDKLLCVPNNNNQDKYCTSNGLTWLLATQVSFIEKAELFIDSISLLQKSAGVRSVV